MGIDKIYGRCVLGITALVLFVGGMNVLSKLDSALSAEARWYKWNRIE